VLLLTFAPQANDAKTTGTFHVLPDSYEKIPGKLQKNCKILAPAALAEERVFYGVVKLHDPRWEDQISPEKVSFLAC
jgi:hypothetical protein